VLELKANPISPPAVPSWKPNWIADAASGHRAGGGRDIEQGDPFVCGAHSGRVRAMIDDKGSKVSDAGPATPVEILG